MSPNMVLLSVFIRIFTRKKRMKGVLYLDVPPHLHEFLIAEYQSQGDFIEIKQQDQLFESLKYILNLNYDKVPAAPYPNYRRISLLVPWFRIDNKRINPLFRNYLSPSQQHKVRRELNRLFKIRAHTFILGMCMAGQRQSDAIRSFFTLYNIPENHINYEMIKKSWDRSHEKFTLYKTLEKV